MFGKTIKKLSKRASAHDGKKAHNSCAYYKVGRISFGSEASKYISIGDIIVSDRTLAHIVKSRYTKIDNLIKKYHGGKIDDKLRTNLALEYIKQVFANYNSLLYDCKNNSYIFVCKNGINLFNNNQIQGGIVALKAGFFGEKIIYDTITVHPYNESGLEKYEWLCDIPR